MFPRARWKRWEFIHSFIYIDEGDGDRVVAPSLDTLTDIMILVTLRLLQVLTGDVLLENNRVIFRYIVSSYGYPYL